jgi:hypothetical protein
MAREDNTPTWLEEVKQAAKYNVVRSIREQEENQRVAAARRAGVLDEMVDIEIAKLKKANRKEEDAPVETETVEKAPVKSTAKKSSK